MHRKLAAACLALVLAFLAWIWARTIEKVPPRDGGAVRPQEPERVLTKPEAPPLTAPESGREPPDTPVAVTPRKTAEEADTKTQKSFRIEPGSFLAISQAPPARRTRGETGAFQSTYSQRSRNRPLAPGNEKAPETACFRGFSCWWT